MREKSEEVSPPYKLRVEKVTECHQPKCHSAISSIDAQMAFFGTGCIINEQVILQDQEGVLAWVSERLAVAMRQAEDLILRDYLVSAASPINAGGGGNADNPSNLGASDFSLVAATL